ncbi:MAG: TonB-dependent receptor [Pseudomonadota bacterium]
MTKPLVLLVLSIFLVVPSALGQEIPASSAVRQILLPTEFARFAPRTALDMASQVPGFPINEENGDRGFGQADTNVLINRRRVSGKSNGPLDALGRIPAGDVLRIEILDGASLEIGGLSGQVLNVVTATDGQISGRYRYSPQFRTDAIPDRWRNGELSISGGGSSSEWTMSVLNEQSRFGSAGPEFVVDGNNTLIDTRNEGNENLIDEPGLAGFFTRETDTGSVLNLTGEVNWFLFRGEEFSEREPVNDVSQSRFFRRTEDEFNFEVGVDYEFDFLGARLKLIGLHRFESSPTESQVDLNFSDGRTPTGSLFNREADEAETVIRTEYSFDALDGNWQWAIEATRNFLDIEAELQERNASGDLVPVDFAGATARVDEDRAETTLSYSRALTDKLQLQTSLGVEYSEISQSGEFGLTRDFYRGKGFASLNYRASQDLNVSLQIERRVGQLQFFDFIASVNVNQDTVNVTNANLVPPQSWVIDLEVQKSLGSLGSITIGGFYEDVSDIVDLIPIQGGGQAPGNLDSAERYGASVNMTLIFDTLGWPGGRLDLEAFFTDSEVADPLLGTNRRISADDQFDYEVTIRQDFPQTDWAAGIEMSYQEDTPSVRLDEISVFRPSTAFAEVFVENKDFFGVTLRGSVGNVFDRGNDFFRTVFNDRVAGDIAFREDRFREFGLLLRLDIEGSF